ncbi:MAG: universal stress protein, partial [Paracoccus sp. (in: a-proteobacteria)]|nr:universal stress protein [Paracoccus sp. (in: a-proteobacteria)]
MGRILALVDGSIYCESVCRHAVWVARQNGAAVDVVHVLGRREVGFRLALGANGKRPGQDNGRAETELSHLVQMRGQAILDKAHDLISAENITVTTGLMKGDLLSVLRDVAAGAELIVIGKRGEAADFATGHLGSNLERVVRAARLPIFVASRAFRPIS